MKSVMNIEFFRSASQRLRISLRWDRHPTPISPCGNPVLISASVPLMMCCKRTREGCCNKICQRQQPPRLGARAGTGPRPTVCRLPAGWKGSDYAVVAGTAAHADCYDLPHAQSHGWSTAAAASCVAQPAPVWQRRRSLYRATFATEDVPDGAFAAPLRPVYPHARHDRRPGCKAGRNVLPSENRQKTSAPSTSSNATSVTSGKW